ncbi:MAG: hypothetical protein IKR81_07400 [Victivallales bacterium]|nr:hypothetical protein [Victivallales bacterium]
MDNTENNKDHTIQLPDINSANNLGLQEREMLILITGPQKRLDYPTEKMKMSNGCEVERYIIPEEDRQKVLDALYPFTDKPSLDDERLDLHTNRKFKVRDYIVTREGEGNFLVTPYYAEAGGTVLDWVMPNEDTNDKTDDGDFAIDVKGIRK